MVNLVYDKGDTSQQCAKKVFIKWCWNNWLAIWKGNRIESLSCFLFQNKIQMIQRLKGEKRKIIKYWMKIWMAVLINLRWKRTVLSVTNKYKLKYRISQGLGVQVLKAATWVEILVPHALALSWKIKSLYLNFSFLIYKIIPTSLVDWRKKLCLGIFFKKIN